MSTGLLEGAGEGERHVPWERRGASMAMVKILADVPALLVLGDEGGDGGELLGMALVEEMLGEGLGTSSTMGGRLSYVLRPERRT